MPKSCAAPECRRTEGPLESYYKFPLHDKVRLKQWLANMNVENFFPTKNQHLCSRHFKPSCFQIRWGVRYLKHDAVPTIFSSSSPGASGKANAAKSRTLSSAQNVNHKIFLPAVAPAGLSEAQVLPPTMAIALDPAFTGGPVCINGAEVIATNPGTSIVGGALNLVPLVHFVESFDGLSLALAPSQGFTSVALPIKVSGQPLVPGQEIPLVEPVRFLSQEEEQHMAATTLQQDLYNSQILPSVDGEGAAAAAFIDMNEASVAVEDVAIEPFFEAGLPTPEPVTMSQEEVMSYLETIQTATVVPAAETGPLPPLMSSPDTVLSASVTRPIPSTVPIVSKRAEEEVVVSEEVMVEPDLAQGEEGLAESLTTAELVSVVVNLQKKVSALQQRHQKHRSKLEVMEGVVEQLKKENLISEDRLNFLDLAGLTPSPTSSEGSETITILCQEDSSQPLVYTFPFPGDSRTVFHITEQ